MYFTLFKNGFTGVREPYCNGLSLYGCKVHQIFDFSLQITPRKKIAGILFLKMHIATGVESKLQAITSEIHVYSAVVGNVLFLRRVPHPVMSFAASSQAAKRKHEEVLSQNFALSK